MSMSPENYRNMENNCRALIKQAEMFLLGKTVDGQTIPMKCAIDEFALSNALSEKYNECIMGAKNVETDATREKYALLAQELNICRGKIQAYYKID